MISFLQKLVFTAATCVALSMAVLTASAQTTTKKVAKPSGPTWRVNCTNQANPAALSCAMTQTIYRAKPRTRILSVTLSRSSSKVMVLRLQLPHGLNLTKGVGLSVDASSPVNYPIQTANAQGAFATIVASDGLVESMKSGSKLTVALVGAAGRAINVELSLSGFAQSLNLMK